MNQALSIFAAGYSLVLKTEYQISHVATWFSGLTEAVQEARL